MLNWITQLTENPMPIRELTPISLEHEIISNDIVVIEFYASWCEICQSFAPVLEDAVEANADISFGKIDADREPDLAGEFDIKAVPTLLIFREKTLVFKEAGAPPPPILEEVIKQARGLDMDQVRMDLGLE